MATSTSASKLSLIPALSILDEHTPYSVSCHSTLSVTFTGKRQLQRNSQDVLLLGVPLLLWGAVVIIAYGTTIQELQEVNIMNCSLLIPPWLSDNESTCEVLQPVTGSYGCDNAAMLAGNDTLLYANASSLVVWRMHRSILQHLPVQASIATVAAQFGTCMYGPAAIPSLIKELSHADGRDIHTCRHLHARDD